MAREVQPNLIVLDADMAKADRYSLCHELQVGPDGWQAPVLLVSKPGELLANVSALECGAIDYLNKPVAPREAIARVRTHLRLQHALEMAGEFQTANLHVLEVAQQACMPRPDDIPGAGFHVALRQAQSAGGDFYDVIDLGHQQFDYLVADASGHDLSSSYWTLALKTLLLEYSTLLFSPADALHLINRALCRTCPKAFSSPRSIWPESSNRQRVAAECRTSSRDLLRRCSKQMPPHRAAQRCSGVFPGCAIPPN